MPDLFIRGAGTYAAHLNADNPARHHAEHRAHAARPRQGSPRTNSERAERLEKTLTDYQAQANRPFEHEARLKELLARQAQLNAALDLDKSDAQAAEPAAESQLGAAIPLSREPAAPKVARNPTPAPRL